LKRFVQDGGILHLKKENDFILKLANFDSWTQSYDRELQRQRCKFLQRYG
jgi:hypothetical protein